MLLLLSLNEEPKLPNHVGKGTGISKYTAEMNKYIHTHTHNCIARPGQHSGLPDIATFSKYYLICIFSLVPLLPYCRNR